MIDNVVKRYRVLVLLGVFLAAYGVVAVRLWTEQLTKGADYAETVSSQSVRNVRIPAIRGRIFTSDGYALADNTPCYNIVFHLAEMRVPGRRFKTVDNILSCADRLALILGRGHGLTANGISSHMASKPAMPVTVFEALNAKELAAASELTPTILGMEITILPRRRYPAGKTACHILGYVSSEDPGKASDREQYSYYIPDLVGRSGLEKLLDDHIAIGPGFDGLIGEAGNNLLIVDAKGYTHDDLGVSRPPRDGNEVALTLNYTAQAVAETLLEGRKASVVVLNAKNGAILAMASSPSFNPNHFVPRISRAEWNKLIKDPAKPLLNRAMVGEYMPGSIIKPLVALAALKAGIDPTATINCSGGSQIGNTQIHCWIWKSGGHGPLDMINATMQSCNCYFIEIGRRTGLNALAEMMAAGGIGRSAGIGLPESSGKLPSRSLKRKLQGGEWNEYDTCLISIGQGLVTLTTLQAAIYTAALANGGTVWRPRLVESVYNHEHTLLYTQPPTIVDMLPVTPEFIGIVKKGMFKVVNDPDGTGKKAKTDVATVYGKTGTAQIGTAENRRRQTWFSGFAEHGDDLYAITVSVEDGLSGGVSCAPLVKKFFEDFLK